MANTVLQTDIFAAGSGSTSMSPTFPSNTTSGTRLVIVFTAEVPGISAISFSDNKNGSYTLDYDSGTLAGSSGNGGGRVLFYSVANTWTGAGLAITGGWTTASDCTAAVYELSGGNASYFDLGTSASGASSTNALGFSITTTHPNETIFVAGLNLNNPSGTVPDTGYTLTTTTQGIGNPIGGTVDWNTHEYIANAGAAGAKALSLNGSAVTGGASLVAVGYRTAGDTGGGAALMGQICTISKDTIW